MGFTHYFGGHAKSHPQKKWDAFIKDCRKLYKNMPEHSLSAGGHYSNEPLLLCGVSDSDAPEFSKDRILFNGCGDLGHETFHLSRKASEGDFCKTARKPYDLMVTACLVLYKAYFPKVGIGSDGDIADWQEAFKFIAETLPKGQVIAFKMLFSEKLFEDVA